LVNEIQVETLRSGRFRLRLGGVDGYREEEEETKGNIDDFREECSKEFQIDGEEQFGVY